MKKSDVCISRAILGRHATEMRASQSHAPTLRCSECTVVSSPASCMCCRCCCAAASRSACSRCCCPAFSAREEDPTRLCWARRSAAEAASCCRRAGEMAGLLPASPPCPCAPPSSVSLSMGDTRKEVRLAMPRRLLLLLVAGPEGLLVGGDGSGGGGSGPPAADAASWDAGEALPAPQRSRELRWRSRERPGTRPCC